MKTAARGSAASKQRQRASEGMKPRAAGWLVPAALLLVSLIVRIPYVFTERLWPDEALYALIARDFVANPASLLRVEAYAEHLPVVPALLSVGLVFGNGLAGLRVVTLLINLIGILATWRLGERIAGRFTGICAALFLAVNVGYLHHSHLILIDGPFAVAHVGLALALLNVRPGPGWDRHDLVVGLAAAGVAVIKWYAALMIVPIVAVYYLVACKDLALPQRLRKLALPALCLAVVVTPYLIWKMAYVGGHGGIVSYFQRPATYYLLTAPGFVGGPLSLCVILVGTFFLRRQAARIQALMAAVIVVELVVMSLAPEKDGRYILPILPFLGVVYALGIGGIVDALVRGTAGRARAQAVAIGLLSLQFIPFVLDKDRTPMNSAYTGFMEAGETVRRAAGPEAMILAGSVRAMRYAVGREQADRVQALPATVAELEAILGRHRGRIVLESDRWEYTQPAWLFPWTDAKIESLRARGFQTTTSIQRPFRGRVVPAVMILTRD